MRELEAARKRAQESATPALVIDGGWRREDDRYMVVSPRECAPGDCVVYVNGPAWQMGYRPRSGAVQAPVRFDPRAAVGMK